LIRFIVLSSSTPGVFVSHIQAKRFDKYLYKHHFYGIDPNEFIIDPQGISWRRLRPRETQRFPTGHVPRSRLSLGLRLDLVTRSVSAFRLGRKMIPMTRSRVLAVWSNPGNPPAAVARQLGMEPRHFTRALHKIKAASDLPAPIAWSK